MDNRITMKKKDYLQKLKKDVRKVSILRMSKRIGVPYANLYRIVNDQGLGSVKIWYKIEDYYG